MDSVTSQRFTGWGMVLFDDASDDNASREHANFFVDHVLPVQLRNKVSHCCLQGIR